MIRTRCTTIAAALFGLVLAVGTVRAAEDPLGQWDLNVEWPQAAAKVLLTVERVDGALKVTWAGPRGSLEGKSPAFANDVLTFAIEVANQGGEHVDLRYEGHIKGSEITGKLVTPTGKEIGASGSRRAHAAAAPRLRTSAG
jgi:hypothetical protein